MGCKFQPNCGGCCFRDKSEEEYRNYKAAKVKGILDAGLLNKNYKWEPPVFLPDGSRRRAAMTFSYRNNQLALGFNENKSGTIVDCRQCLMLTSLLNDMLLGLRRFLENFCKIKTTVKGKGKKVVEKSFLRGDLHILQSDNGIDIVLESDGELTLEHRMEIFDYVNGADKIIRFSFRKNSESEAEPVIEKIKPVIKIGGTDVYVAPGTFLQASKAGEESLINLVLRYLGGVNGQVADLFCGIGTFSYPMSKMPDVQVIAADVNAKLLAGFEMSVNRQMLHNIKIVRRNLFKYPFTAEELENFSAVVFDPPRAGAAGQMRELALADKSKRPQKIVAVSCNPHSFVTDANILINAGYTLNQVTMVDQFVYSNHSELAALFTN